MDSFYAFNELRAFVLGFGRNYNLAHKNDSGLTYMPEGMEDRAYF